MAKKLNYKQSITEIENIISEIEKEELDVDILSEKVKYAAELIKNCKEKLTKTESEIQDILSEIE